MKRLNLFTIGVLGLAVVCLLTTGCRKRVTRITPIHGVARTTLTEDSERLRPVGPGQEPVISSEIKQPPRERHDLWIQDREKFKSETVYFDFDSSAIKPGERPKIERVAAYLRQNPTHDVLIEGHCDERGTIEYNRALGDRRAQAIRAVLVELGIAPERIDTISYGEERPVDPGHNEEAWAKNRRGEFVLLLPP